MVGQYEEYGSNVESMLKGMPEVIDFFPGKGNIAVNITSSHGDYWVAIGERVGNQFVKVAQSTSKQIPNDVDLGTIADRELLPFGDKAKIFDVFLDGKLTREAQR